MPAKVKKSILNLKESVRHKREESKVDYSVGECFGNRLKETYEDHRAGCKHLREGDMLDRASFLLQDNMNLKF